MDTDHILPGGLSDVGVEIPLAVHDVGAHGAGLAVVGLQELDGLHFVGIVALISTVFLVNLLGFCYCRGRSSYLNVATIDFDGRVQRRHQRQRRGEERDERPAEQRRVFHDGGGGFTTEPSGRPSTPSCTFSTLPLSTRGRLSERERPAAAHLWPTTSIVHPQHHQRNVQEAPPRTFYAPSLAFP